MALRTLSATVLPAAAAALNGGIALAPSGQAAPSGDASPACVAEGTCALLTPTARYLPLTPASAPQQAPLTALTPQ